jgi:valyl-tRNA synthetase
MSKGRLRDAASRPLAQRVLAGVLDAILRLVHLVMPFVAESIWQALSEAAFERGLPAPEPSAESIVIAPWPEFSASWRDKTTEIRIARMQELVGIVREIRNRYSIGSRTPLGVTVRCGAEVAGDLRSLAPFLTSLAGVGHLDCGPDVKKPRLAATQVGPDFEAWVPLEGLIDIPAEIKRLEKQIAEKNKQLQAARGKLENSGFIERAPADVVEQQRALVADVQNQVQSMEASLAELRAG